MLDCAAGVASLILWRPHWLGGILMWIIVSCAYAEPQGAPHIQWVHCPNGYHAGYSAATMRCGWFDTGQRLDGQPVRLRLTRLQAHPDRPTPHPVIYVPGGPGDPGGQDKNALWQWRRFQQQAGWPADMIVFDPRSTGHSTPRLGCPVNQKHRGSIRMADCFHALGAKTANSLGITAQVADLHRLIQGLGQGSAVLWAESYGAVMVRRLLAKHPDDVRMLVLGSPVLAPKSLAQREPQAFVRWRADQIRYCRHRVTCRLTVPSARFLIDGLIAALEHNPVKIGWGRPPRAAREITINASALRTMLLLSGYQKNQGEKVIATLRHALNQPAALAALAGPLAALKSHGSRRAPVYWSTRCQLAPPKSGYGICRHWPVKRLKPIPVHHFVPTLVLTGQQDVLTPAPKAVHFVLSHPGRQWLPVAGIGHGVLFDSACARQAVRTFIATGGTWLGARHCRNRAPSVSKLNGVE